MSSGGFAALMIPMLWKALALAWFEAVRACTYFEIPDGQGKYVSARSMEWFEGVGSIYDWNLATHPVGEGFKTMPLRSKTEVKYGHISVDANMTNKFGFPIAVDGLNTAGLSVSVNVLNTMKVSTAKATFVENPLFYAFIGRWALSLFNSTNEVIEALKNVTVIDAGYEPFGIHFAFSDKSGNSIVIEYNGVNGSMGKPNIYNNSARTLTNDPHYPWMVLNLDSFSYLSPTDVKGRNTNISFNPSGLEYPFDVIPNSVSAGYNLKGLPGDTTPQSRFVKAFYFVNYALLNAAPKGLSCVLTLAQAVFNSLHIPRGVEGPHTPSVAYTQWAAIKAPHMGEKGTFMIRSYVDMQWRSIDLAEAKLEADSPSMKVKVETDELNVANALGTLKQDSVREESGNARRLRRLQSIPCTSGAGLNRSNGLSCHFQADNSVPHDNIALDNSASPRFMIATVVGVACLMCGTFAGYLLGRQHKRRLDCA
jgi:choloylglycine hydrolase